MVCSRCFPLIPQKTVKYRLTSGVVTYSDAHDAFDAMMKLSGRADFFVGGLYRKGGRETYEKKRPEREYPFYLRDFMDIPPPPLPSLLNTLSPPVYSQVMRHKTVFVLFHFFYFVVDFRCLG